jgi:hypothetical protein
MTSKEFCHVILFFQTLYKSFLKHSGTVWKLIREIRMVLRPSKHENFCGMEFIYKHGTTEWELKFQLFIINRQDKS